jgi:hypothetical protein
VAVGRSRFTQCGDSPCFLNMAQPISLFSGKHISIRASESGVRGCSQLGTIKRDPETHPTGNPRTNLRRHSQQPPSRTRNAPFPLIPHMGPYNQQQCNSVTGDQIHRLMRGTLRYGRPGRRSKAASPANICAVCTMTKSHFSYVQARTFSPFSLLFPSICLLC